MKLRDSLIELAKLLAEMQEERKKPPNRVWIRWFDELQLTKMVHVLQRLKSLPIIVPLQSSLLPKLPGKHTAESMHCAFADNLPMIQGMLQVPKADSMKEY
jgi:hypothetical protein